MLTNDQIQYFCSVGVRGFKYHETKAPALTYHHIGQLYNTLLSCLVEWGFYPLFLQRVFQEIQMDLRLNFNVVYSDNGWFFQWGIGELHISAHHYTTADAATEAAVVKYYEIKCE